MKNIRPALILFTLLSLLLGVAYPGLLTAVAQTVFPREAQGSLIEKNCKYMYAGNPQCERVLGSRLIGQNFTDPKYFWGRPSATKPYPYNTAASGASNLGVANPALLDAVRARIYNLKAADPENTKPIPVDLVTSSGSGLDPHISPAAAEYQIARVAKARGLSQEQVHAKVAQYTQKRTFGFLGEPVVNVLMLNLSMDGDL